MQSETWQDYGTAGTQALGHKEIEQAIARLARMWDDAQAQAQEDRVRPRKSAAMAATGRPADRLTTHVRWS
jgi:hypothetical protein